MYTLSNTNPPPSKAHFCPMNSDLLWVLVGVELSPFLLLLLQAPPLALCSHLYGGLPHTSRHRVLQVIVIVMNLHRWRRAFEYPWFGLSVHQTPGLCGVGRLIIGSLRDSSLFLMVSTVLASICQFYYTTTNTPLLPTAPVTSGGTDLEWLQPLPFTPRLRLFLLLLPCLPLRHIKVTVDFIVLFFLCLVRR